MLMFEVVCDLLQSEDFCQVFILSFPIKVYMPDMLQNKLSGDYNCLIALSTHLGILSVFIFTSKTFLSYNSFRKSLYGQRCIDLSYT